jgi:hypothetical protein
MKGLVRFLLARLDDETREAQRLLRGGEGDPDNAALVARRRADLSAKRTAIGELQRQIAFRDLPHQRPVRVQALQKLREMTKPYADHRGYQAEWAFIATSERQQPRPHRV